MLPLFVSLFPLTSRFVVSILLVFSRFPVIVNLSPEAIVPVFFRFFTSIFSLAIIFWLLIKSEVTKFLLVRILPLFVVFPVTSILSIALTSPVLVKGPLIFILLFVTTFPLFSSLDTVIFLFTLNSFSFLISFDSKEPLVKIVPLFKTLFVAVMFSIAWILPEFVKRPSIFKFLAVTTFPLFSNLAILISLLTLITLSFLTSFDVRVPFVKISPVFTVFSFILISSNVWISPLLVKLPSTFNFLFDITFPEFSNLSTEIPSFAINFLVDIVSLAVRFLFVRISPLFVKFPSTSILFVAWTTPVLVKAFVFIPSFVYIVALFSTVPFRLICLFACVPVPDNLILSAFIDIPSSEYAKSFCSYSFPLISIPLPCTLFTFIFPSAVISNLLFLDTIKASEFTPAPLSVLIIFIVFAYIPPSSFASIAILLVEVVLLEPATTFKSLATTFPLNSSVFAISST